jgi:glycosyltransferase involved in cell wall biosynthesis
MLSAMTHANVIAMASKRVSGVRVPLVVSERSTISAEAQRAASLSAKAVFLLARCLYKRADQVLAVSHDAASDLEEFASLKKGSVRAIYNPFDLKAIERLSSDALPHPWFVSSQPPVIIAAGRLSAQKDFSTLIRAFEKVRRTTKARLLILGEGDMRVELAALADRLGLQEDDIQMPGFVANPFAYVSRAAVFVLSSKWEGLPGVLIEAMACGTPVVSADCRSGPREILEDGKWGRLVPVGDVSGFATAIVEVLSTPKVDLPLVRRRADVFGMDSSVDAYLSVLQLPSHAEAISL